jgi:hypothetical protein
MTNVSGAGGRRASRPPNRWMALLAAALLSTGLGGCGGDPESGQPAAQSGPVIVERPPEMANDYQPHDLPGRPEPGTVTVTPTTFTDQVEFSQLDFVAGQPPKVTGSFASTIEVSPVLLAEFAADFFDAEGRYVGSSNAVLKGTHSESASADPDSHESSDDHGDSASFTITGPAGDAVAANLRVVQYVIE